MMLVLRIYWRAMKPKILSFNLVYVMNVMAHDMLRNISQARKTPYNANAKLTSALL